MTEPDDQDAARELIGAAGLPPDMPRILSEVEAQNAVNWMRTVIGHIVLGHLTVSADTDEVAGKLVRQVRDVDAMVRKYLYRGTDRTVRPEEEQPTTEIISQAEMADVMVRTCLKYYLNGDGHGDPGTA